MASILSRPQCVKNVTLVAITGTTSLMPDVFKSNPCSSCEDQAPIDFIYRWCPIFRWVAEMWLHGRVSSPSHGHQVANLMTQVTSLCSTAKCRRVWSDIAWHCTHHCRKWGRLSIRGWTHKRHPIPHPDRWAMGCLPWIFWRKTIAL